MSYWLFTYKILLEEARLLLGTKKWFARYFSVRHGDRFVSKQTDIVIEGAPSSGNSFAVKSFELAQKRSVSVAHHLHIPLQVILSVENKIPCIILLREPLDAVVSRTARRGYFLPGNPYTTWVLKRRLLYWKKFYTAITPHIDDCVICTFDNLRMDFGEIIEHVNKVYNTTFDIPTEEDTKAALRSLAETVRPTNWRNKLKEDLKIWAEGESVLTPLIGECRIIYHRLSKRRDRL